jgi:hypothetical protein
VALVQFGLDLDAFSVVVFAMSWAMTRREPVPERS